VYYYNTSNVFAEEPEGNATFSSLKLEKLMGNSAAIQRLDESIKHIQESRQPTIDAIVEEKRLREAQAVAEEQKRRRIAEKSVAKEGQGGHVQEGEEELEGLEEEADQQGAFNPETGEINWDCPCLGGMAHGPCGEEFKAAFSCFVYSNEEPKGVECIEKFK
jgi:mitochondrial intermembrane space import and assembly protein 40